MRKRRNITISDDVYREILEVIEEINRKAGCRKIRSVAHFIELAVADYVKRISSET